MNFQLFSDISLCNGLTGSYFLGISLDFTATTFLGECDHASTKKHTGALFAFLLHIFSRSSWRVEGVCPMLSGSEDSSFHDCSFSSEMGGRHLQSQSLAANGCKWAIHQSKRQPSQVKPHRGQIEQLFREDVS